MRQKSTDHGLVKSPNLDSLQVDTIVDKICLDTHL